MKNIIVYLLLVITIGASCQGQDKSYKKEKQPESRICEVDKFVGSDTSGVFTGTIIVFHEYNPNRPVRDLWTLDNEGDTISFHILLKETGSETNNVVEEKLLPGKCITVTYETEIVEEDGLEYSKFYNATRLDYP